MSDRREGAVGFGGALVKKEDVVGFIRARPRVSMEDLRNYFFPRDLSPQVEQYVTDVVSRLKNGHRIVYRDGAIFWCAEERVRNPYRMG